MITKMTAITAALLSTFVAATPASAVAINSKKCVSVADAAGCLYEGNIGNTRDAAAAQKQYNAIRDPDIMLTFLGKSDAGFGVASFSDASKTSGTWFAPGFLVSFIAVKAGPEFVLYKLSAPTSSGSWSTAGLVNGKDIKKELSHLTYFGSRSAVPEPASWGMLLLGFGIVGSVLRRRSRALAII